MDDAGVRVFLPIVTTRSMRYMRAPWPKKRAWGTEGFWFQHFGVWRHVQFANVRAAMRNAAPWNILHPRQRCASSTSD
eukprot:4047245-Pyramimonas_sp.AAC.1